MELERRNLHFSHSSVVIGREVENSLTERMRERKAVKGQ